MITGLWRWRGNPLRRATDALEAWVALSALLAMLLVAPLVGAAVGASSSAALNRAVQVQHDSRHRVQATVDKISGHYRVDPDPETSSHQDTGARVQADWQAPDGTWQHGSVASGRAHPQVGEAFTLWVDDQGRPVAPPMASGTAGVHAALAGIGAAGLTVGLIEGLRRLAVWSMLRRRYAQWDTEWAKAGPDWGRTGTGS
ncbi:Rv1733c family protein [Streptomyces mesophilus]|uniref:Rv1733c family protein n=1 Tax=Streptomyces mesophilus TaxID=1775132 RepID=UPI00332FE174